MCECYQIGGPWIAEDPSCEVHRKGGSNDQMDELRQKLDEALELIAQLTARVEELEAKASS